MRLLLYPNELSNLPRAKLNQHLSRAPNSVITTPVTLTDDDWVVLVDDDTVGGAVTINLPAAADSEGNIYYIKKLGTTGSVTIDPNGSETIDGATTLIITQQYDAPEIYCNSVEWLII